MKRYEVKVLKADGEIVTMYIAASHYQRAVWIAGAYGVVLPKNGKYRIVE
jgi:hypothetical protein